MSDPLSPEQLEALLAGYVLDDLTPEEAEQFEQRLREEPELIIEVKRLQEALDVLPYALPEVEPPPRLKEAILAATALETTSSSVRQLPRLRWSKLVAGAVALLGLLLAWDNYRLRQELAVAKQDAQEEQTLVAALQQVVAVLQQPDTRVFALVGTDQANAASGSIAIDFQEKKAAIVFQNLPAPSEDKIYRLWAIIEHKKVACANFKTTAQGKVSEVFSLPAAACSSAQSTLAVSLEPMSLPPQPVGPVVMLEKS